MMRVCCDYCGAEVGPDDGRFTVCGYGQAHYGHRGCVRAMLSVVGDPCRPFTLDGDA